MSIEIMNLKNSKPEQPYDVKVDRSSVLGNPFGMSYRDEEFTRDKVCEKYEKWFNEKLNLTCDQQVIRELLRLSDLHWRYRRLRLFCWCAPLRCHAEIIRKYIEEQEGGKERN